MDNLSRLFLFSSTVCSYLPSKPTPELKDTILLQRMHVNALPLSLRMYWESCFRCTFPVVDAHKVSTWHAFEGVKKGDRNKIKGLGTVHLNASTKKSNKKIILPQRLEVLYNLLLGSSKLLMFLTYKLNVIAHTTPQIHTSYFHS